MTYKEELEEARLRAAKRGVRKNTWAEWMFNSINTLHCLGFSGAQEVRDVACKFGHFTKRNKK